ncbi:MAG: N-glycosylase/DNA lyase [Nanoarchaeota archaeon]|nr:N-glycosylase/DNA lyase [Nanoarchaeota archaeon]
MLVQHYQQKKLVIQKRLEEFSVIPQSEYFYELCFCLLTPASSAKICHAAVESLRKVNFYQRDIDPFSYVRLVRFNKTKAQRLVKAKRQFPVILEKINALDARSLRLWLADHVDGFGLKESAHFLRNIGFKNLGILDRHILKHLVRHKVISSLPKSLTRKRYFAIEEKFQQFAQRVGIPMDELDLLFWSSETGEVFK